jgi:DNA-nicking Smr family endonuclease
MDISNILNDWLDHHPPAPKDEETQDEAAARREASARRAELRRRAPEATIDLHGSTIVEAIARTDRFLREAKKAGLRKVLIIHGKGNHTQNGTSVLRENVRGYVRNHPFAGETGVPDRSEGGEGAFWVAIR